MKKHRVGFYNRDCSLERSVHFLGEKRTKLYKRYCLGVSEAKNVLNAKSSLRSWALLNLERSVEWL